MLFIHVSWERIHVKREENISKRFNRLENIVAQSAASYQECPMRQGKYDGETEKKKV